MENKEKTIKGEELKEGVAIHKNLNPVSLIIRDDEKLKKLVSKSFADMTEEEKKQLPTAKFRIVSKKNTFSGKNERYVRVIFTEGVYFERLLGAEDGEKELLKVFYPQLFETPKTKDDIVYIDVPVRLYSYYNEEKNRYSYQFSAELCSSVIMRGRVKRSKTTSKTYYLNNFNEKQLKLLLLRDLKYKFVLMDSPVVDEENDEVPFDDDDEN